MWCVTYTVTLGFQTHQPYAGASHWVHPGLTRQRVLSEVEKISSSFACFALALVTQLVGGLTSGFKKLASCESLHTVQVMLHVSAACRSSARGRDRKAGRMK